MNNSKKNCTNCKYEHSGEIVLCYDCLFEEERSGSYCKWYPANKELLAADAVVRLRNDLTAKETGIEEIDEYKGKELTIREVFMGSYFIKGILWVFNPDWVVC